MELAVWNSANSQNVLWAFAWRGINKICKTINSWGGCCVLFEALVFEAIGGWEFLAKTAIDYRAKTSAQFTSGNTFIYILVEDERGPRSIHAEDKRSSITWRCDSRSPITGMAALQRCLMVALFQKAVNTFTGSFQCSKLPKISLIFCWNYILREPLPARFISLWREKMRGAKTVISVNNTFIFMCGVLALTIPLFLFMDANYIF